MVFDAISSKVHEVLSISPSANVFDLSLVTLTSIIWSGQPILMEQIELANSVIIIVSNDLSQVVNFPTWIPVTLTVLLFWVYLVCLALVFVPRWLSLH